jgi:hypothetical protein
MIRLRMGPRVVRGARDQQASGRLRIGEELAPPLGTTGRQDRTFAVAFLVARDLIVAARQSG